MKNLSSRLLPLIVSAVLVGLLGACGGSSTTSSSHPASSPPASSQGQGKGQGFCDSTNPSSATGTWNAKCSTIQYTVTYTIPDKQQPTVNNPPPPMFTIPGYTTAVFAIARDAVVYTYTGKSPEIAVYWSTKQNELRVYELPANIVIPNGKIWSFPNARSSSGPN